MTRIHHLQVLTTAVQLTKTDGVIRSSHYFFDCFGILQSASVHAYYVRIEVAVCPHLFSATRSRSIYTGMAADELVTSLTEMIVQALFEPAHCFLGKSSSLLKDVVTHGSLPNSHSNKLAKISA